MRGIVSFSSLCLSLSFTLFRLLTVGKTRRGESVAASSQEPRQPRPVRAVGLLELVAAVAREVDGLARVAGAPAADAAVLLVRVQGVAQRDGALELQARRVGGALLVAAVAVGKVGEVVHALGPDEHAEREGVDGSVAPLEHCR